MLSLSESTGALLRSETRGPCHPEALRDRTPSFLRLSLTDRDRDILVLACRKLGGSTVDFPQAVRALQEAVEERIPAGRTYYLPSDMGGPIIGSIISGVGIAAGADSVLVVRIAPDGGRTILGNLAL
jgi:hypothetical protein